MIIGTEDVFIHQLHQPAVAPCAGKMRGIGIGIIVLGDAVVGAADPALVWVELQGHLRSWHASAPIILCRHRLRHQAVAENSLRHHARGGSRYVPIHVYQRIIEWLGGLAYRGNRLVHAFGQQQIQVAQIGAGILRHRPTQ